MAKYIKLSELTQERQYVSEDTNEELIEVKETVSFSLNLCLIVIVITPNYFQSPNENHGDNEPLLTKNNKKMLKNKKLVSFLIIAK